MKFCIRDDDTNYYTGPSVLESVFGSIWDDVPITLACIPMISPDSDALVKPTESLPMPIGENEELVSYLNDRLRDGSVELALHGYHHDAPNGDPEFVSGERLAEKVKDGRDQLESAFESTIQLFAPPHVRLSNKGVRAVQNAGLDIVRGYGPRPREGQLHPKWWASYAKFLAFYARYRKEFRYPFPIDYGTHREVYSHRLNRQTDLDWCKRAFDYIESKDGVFCLSVHAHGLNQTGQKKLEEMVSYAKQHDPDFVTASAAIAEFNP
ncbi:hypothetical protein Huta_1119 [Halorhabdus utahensis DSM 12940]|uniref:Polysaccharide deacetylase n=1 Tax=Halorhabdus utahensis (strain DSM 12940 / JCM 11049 / AX-2) TaxID=519442 RepID=C7NM89_HALUD|nr:DUF2334 domain-containing protein [Halorhabdus utahensis]ACV11297.1 hypothetical protein Huta_1119 [Halorhabdus utahensis DSM 12940]